MRAWEDVLNTVMLIASVVFMIAFSVPVIWPELGLQREGRIVMDVTWVMFIIEFFFRFYRSEHKRHYLRRHWFEAVALLWPTLRSLAVVRALLVVAHASKRAIGFQRLREAQYLVAGVAVIVGFTCSVLILEAERGQPGTKIMDFGDATWWTLVTMTTVGYGDIVPVTDQGRWIAAGAMIVGVGVFGTVTASFSSWFASLRTRHLTDPDGSVSLAPVQFESTGPAPLVTAGNTWDAAKIREMQREVEKLTKQLADLSECMSLTHSPPSESDQDASGQAPPKENS